MREYLQRFRIIIATSVRVDPVRSLGALAEPLGGAFQMLLGLWVKLLVDGVTRHDRTHATIGAVGIVASMLLYWGTGLLGNLARVALAERVGFAFDQQIARITATIPSLDPFERADYADQLQILRQNRAVLGASLNNLLYTIVTVVKAVTALVVLTAVDPRLLLLLAAAIPAVAGARLRYRWAKAAEDESAAHGRLARHLVGITTTVTGAAEVRTYRLQEELRRRLREANAAWRRPVVVSRIKGAATSAIVNGGFAATLTGVLVWLVVGASHGSVPAGTIAMAVVVAGDLQSVVVGTVNRVGALADVLRSAGRFRWLQERSAQIEQQYSGTVAPPTQLRDGITFENVSFRYPGAAEDALRDVSLHIPAGSVLALVGENGAGKSTVVGLLAGLHRPT
ncbi:MAG TPA: ABC transporter ATP-binding protein, partial [Mycobacteriales bacterium]|nr:ABC transporter ATP-binding protein [Mycobacteriales bacterium]